MPTLADRETLYEQASAPIAIGETVKVVHGKQRGLVGKVLAAGRVLTIADRRGPTLADVFAYVFAADCERADREHHVQPGQGRDQTERELREVIAVLRQAAADASDHQMKAAEHNADLRAELKAAESIIGRGDSRLAAQDAIIRKLENQREADIREIAVLRSRIRSLS